MTMRAPYFKNGLKKGAWSKDEDERLRSFIQTHGVSNWRKLPKSAGLLRCGKSCRLRWVNYLQPNLKHGNYTQEEEEIIIKVHEQLGNKWSVIAEKLPGRTDNEIKNHWHSHLKKLLECNEIKKSEDRGKPNDHTCDCKEITQHMGYKNPISVGSSSCNILESSLLPISTETSYEEDKSSSFTNNNTSQSAMKYWSREEDIFATSCETFDEFGGDFWTNPFIMQNSYSQDHNFAMSISGAINGGYTDPYFSYSYDATELFYQVMPEFPKE